LEGVVGFVVREIAGFGINTDIGMDSDIGLYMDKEIESVVATMM